MRCPVCQTSNPPTATCCANCQAALPGMAREARRRKAAAESGDNPRTLEYDRRMQRLFGLWAWSLIPFVGLVMGPVSAFLTWRLLRAGHGDPAFTAQRAARATMILGMLTGVTNWLGLGLMLLGNW